MKRSLYNMALAICTAAAMYSCSLDEYNPSDTSGEGELKTVEGLKNLGTYCYSPLYDQMFSASDYLAVAYNPQIQISAESETKRSIFRKRDKTKRSKKESAQHSKSRNKSFVMTSVSAL